MAKAFKIPKKIAGVKVPKKLRKGKLAALLASDFGRQLLADTLVAVAGALAASRPVRDKAADAGHEMARAGSKAGDVVRDGVQSAVGAVSGAIGGDSPRRDRRRGEDEARRH